MPNVTGDQPSSETGTTRGREGSEVGGVRRAGSTPAPSSRYLRNVPTKVYPRWLRYPILLPREGF